MKVLKGSQDTIKEILKKLASCELMHFQVSGGKKKDSHGSLAILFPHGDEDRPNYQLLYVEYGYVPFMYLTTIGSPGEVLASDLSHDDVLEIVTKALDKGLEEYIQSRLFKEADECPTLKENGYCEFCSPILRDRDFLNVWLKDIIEIYKKMAMKPVEK